MKKLISFASVLLMGEGCTTPPPPSPNGGAINGSRVQLAAGGQTLPAVSILIPRDFRITQGGGVDTQHAEILGPGVRISSDYGRTGGPQTCGTLPECTRGTISIDGRVGSWMRYPATESANAIDYRERLLLSVQADPAESPAAGPTNQLFLNALCSSKDRCDLVYQMATTIRFDS